MSAMRVYRPRRPNGLVIVTDWSQKNDRLLDAAEGGTHVLEFWKFGKAVLGDAWRDTTRVALFDHGDTPGNKGAAKARDEWRMFLDTERPPVVLVLPTPDASSGESHAVKGTQAWAALDAPDALDEMRGAFWHRGGTYFVPQFAITKRAKELQRWAMSRWMRWGLDVVKGRTRPVAVPAKELFPTDSMVSMLRSMRGQPLAVDLEFVPSTGTITAVGLATDRGAVSVPWDTFTPPRSQEPEPGIFTFGQVGMAVVDEVKALLAATTMKVAHNFPADVPRLESRGLRVGGRLHDTMAAFAIAFPELQKGLQHATVAMMPAEPWKSNWKPAGAKGFTRDDTEFWICEPVGLRNYNCSDAYHTILLAKAIMPSVGAQL